MRRASLLRALAVLCLAAFLGAGCLHQRYRGPAIFAGSGAAFTVAGAVALVPLTDSPAGRVTAVSIMAVGVAALLVAAVWLGVRIRCETAVDCPTGETCQPVPTAGGQSYGVCTPSTSS
jgi:hypothetical protein